MKDMERLHRLLAMAEQDKNFQVWQRSSEELEEKYKKMLRWLPKHFQNTFSNYVGCKAMAHQRTLNIACQSMKFLDEKDES